MTKVLGVGAQRQQINTPQGIREGFSGRSVSWEGCSRQREQYALDFQSTFKYPITNRTRQVEWEELALEAPRTTTRVKVASPSYSKCLLSGMGEYT